VTRARLQQLSLVEVIHPLEIRWRKNTSAGGQLRSASRAGLAAGDDFTAHASLGKRFRQIVITFVSDAAIEHQQPAVVRSDAVPPLTRQTMVNSQANRDFLITSTSAMYFLEYNAEAAHGRNRSIAGALAAL